MFKTSSFIDGLKLSVPDHIAGLAPYPLGKSIEELERGYGLTDSTKPARNENPWRPSPTAVTAIREELTCLHRYPDSQVYTLRKRLREKFHLPFDIEVPTDARAVYEAMFRQGVISLPDECLWDDQYHPRECWIARRKRKVRQDLGPHTS